MLGEKKEFSKYKPYSAYSSQTRIGKYDLNNAIEKRRVDLQTYKEKYNLFIGAGIVDQYPDAEVFVFDDGALVLKYKDLNIDKKAVDKLKIIKQGRY